MTQRAPLHSMRVRAVLAAVAIALLAIGYLLRPEARLPPTPVEQEPSPMLREVVTRRQTIGMFAALQDTARAAVASTARLIAPQPPPERWSDWKPEQQPENVRFGVPIDGTRILGDAADLEEGTLLQIRLGDGRIVPGYVTRRFTASRLAVIEVDAAAALPVPIAALTPAAAGDVVVAVAPGDEGPVTVPLIVAETERRVMRVTGGAERFLGMPVFAAGGDWLGVLAADSDGLRVVPADVVLSEPAAVAPGPPPLGITLRATTTRTGDPQVLVEEVAPDSRAADAGMRAGDVLVQAGNTPIDALDTAVAALQAEGELRLRVRRGNRTTLIRLPAPDNGR